MLERIDRKYFTLVLPFLQISFPDRLGCIVSPSELTERSKCSQRCAPQRRCASASVESAGSILRDVCRVSSLFLVLAAFVASGLGGEDAKKMQHLP